jgi:dihydropteroate synthase
LEQAERKHAVKAAAIQIEVEALEKRSRSEDARWAKERERLDAVLRRARG